MTPLQISLIVAVSLLYAFEGEAIECHYCESGVSFEDCDKNMKRVECAKEFGLDRCMKTQIRASDRTEEKYKRGCMSANGCNNPSCKNSGDDKCEVHCCTGDYCNTLSVTVVSGTTLIVCAMLAFFVKLTA